MPIDFTKPTPLYSQIVDHIKSQIKSGKLKVGDKLGSHHELSKFYRVSLITVKKALNSLVNEKIVYSRVGKGTYVSDQNKQIKFSEYITIGLVLRDLNSPFFSRIVESVEKKASEKGCNLLLSTSSDRKEKEDGLINHFLKMGVSGLIIASMTRAYHASDLIRKLHNENFPYTMVSYMADQEINYAGTDHTYGSNIAAKHFIDIGYEKIGYVNGEKGNILGDLRKEGFIQILKEHDKPIIDKYFFRLSSINGYYFNAGYDFGKSFMKLSDKPEALFIYNDLAAIGFERAVLESGMKIPDDIAIIGFDGIKRGAVAPVPLTTVQQPTNKIGAAAVEMVLGKVAGKKVDNRKIFKPKLLIRQSCGSGKNDYHPVGEEILTNPEYSE